MKKRVLLTFVLTLVLCQVHAKNGAADAQILPLKIGYANVEYIISFLPETKKIESEYRSFETHLKSQLESKAKEFQQKLQALEQGYQTMTEAVRGQKQKELQQLQGNFEQLQAEAQGKLASKHASLLEPIYERVQKAIQQVAQEHAYTHVFNNSLGGMSILLYVSDEHNLSDKVLQQLGIDPDRKAQKEKKK